MGGELVGIEIDLDGAVGGALDVDLADAVGGFDDALHVPVGQHV